MFVDNIEEYMEHVENLRIASGEAEMLAEMKPRTDIEKNDVLKLLLNEIRYLITNNDIQNDTEISKELQSLGRKGNKELISIFEASYDGNFNRENNFDKKFFLDNAIEIVNESLEKKKSVH